MLDERDDGLRRAPAMQDVAVAENAAFCDAFEILEHILRLGPGEADFDASFVAGALFQFARCTESDDLPWSTMATRSQRRSASSM